MYDINLDDKQSKGIHWVSLLDRYATVHSDSFVNEYIPLDVLSKFKVKSIAHNIFGLQDDDSTIFEFYCIAFIEYIIAGKTLLVYTNLFSPNDYKKNGMIIYKHFKDKYDKIKR